MKSLTVCFSIKFSPESLTFYKGSKARRNSLERELVDKTHRLDLSHVLLIAMAGNFFRGTTVEQDGRWGSSDDKLIKKLTKAGIAIKRVFLPPLLLY